MEAKTFEDFENLATDVGMKADQIVDSLFRNGCKRRDEILTSFNQLAKEATDGMITHLTIVLLDEGKNEEAKKLFTGVEKYNLDPFFEKNLKPEIISRNYQFLLEMKVPGNLILKAIRENFKNKCSGCSSELSGLIKICGSHCYHQYCLGDNELKCPRCQIGLI